MTPEQAKAYARGWVQAWNAHDLERILNHYAENIVFRSPYIEAIVGNETAVIRSKEGLRRYWSAALQKYPDLHFEFERVYVSEDAITIAYLNNRAGSVAETLVFGPDGRICEGLAAYM